MPAEPKIHVASRNAKKLEEMFRILSPLVPGVSVVGLDDVTHYDEPVEDAPTFEGNALIKSPPLRRRSAVGGTRCWSG